MNIKNLLFITAAAIGSTQGFAQKVFVDGGIMSIVDAPTRTQTGTVGHGGNFDGIRLSDDGSKLYTYNETLRRIYVVNTATNVKEDSVTFNTFVYDFLPGQGNTLYYSTNPTNKLYKMDLTTKTLVDSSAAVNGSGSALFMPRPGTNEIWVTQEDKIAVFTHSSMALTMVPSGVPGGGYIGGQPTFNNDGSKFYYFSKPNGQEGVLTRMDAASKAKEDSLITPDYHGNLKCLTLLGNDTMLLTYFGLWPNEPSMIYRGSNSTMTIVDSIATSKKPFTMTRRPGTNELWVVYHYDAMVGIMDIASNFASIDSVDVGSSPKELVFVADATSIGSAPAAVKMVSVYPNPTTGIVTVAPTAAMSNAHYTVTDVTGKVVMKGNLTGKTAIDLQLQTAGMYMLQVNTGSNVASYKIIKQ